MCVCVSSATHDLTASLISAAPKITKLETRQQFNWCIYYEFKGYPTPNKTWMFNGDLLVPSSNVFDSAINQYKGPAFYA